MPYPNSNHPDQWGWQHGDAADIVPFSYGGHIFYNGVARGTERLFKLALDTIIPRIPGGIYQANDQPSPDDGTWGYEDRISRNSSAISFHAFGLALDINAVQNPNATDVPPASPYRLPQNTGDLLDAACGQGMFRFGGDWGDWMHIEIHGSPSEVAAWNAAHPEGGSSIPNTPAAPAPVSTSLLEDIMALDRNSDDYKNLVADIANAVLDDQLPTPTGSAVPFTTLRRAIPLMQKNVDNNAKLAQADLNVDQAHAADDAADRTRAAQIKAAQQAAK
jgi:hypothetical protein